MYYCHVCITVTSSLSKRKTKSSVNSLECSVLKHKTLTNFQMNKNFTIFFVLLPRMETGNGQENAV